MAVALGPAEANGLLKEVYNEIKDLVPNDIQLLKDVSFVQSDSENGLNFNEGVILTTSQGFTAGSANTSNYTLNNAVSLETKMAQVAGPQITLSGVLDWGTIARSSSPKKAFKKSASLLMSDMMKSMKRRLEVLGFYGQSGLATAASSANTNTTTTVVTITTSEWAAGIWTGGRNMKVNFVGSTTWVGSGTALTGNPTADDIFTVTSINTSTRAITVTGTTTGIGNLDTFIAANPNVASIYYNGFYGNTTDGSNELAGCKKILTNTGTLFGISASTYDLWKGNTYSAGSGNMTLPKTLAAVAMAVDRGLAEDVIMYVNQRTFASMNSDQAALRQYTGDIGEEGVNAFSKLVFQGPVGLITIKGHSCVKEGDAFILPTGDMIRPGACEPQFTPPGLDVPIAIPLESSNGYGVRLYTNQAIFLSTPARGVYVSGIVNS